MKVEKPHELDNACECTRFFVVVVVVTHFLFIYMINIYMYVYVVKGAELGKKDKDNSMERKLKECFSNLSRLISIFFYLLYVFFMLQM